MAHPQPTLGKYQLLEEIGRGGMGTVYRGFDPFLDRTVAIKLLAPSLIYQPGFVERFLREARAAARLRHPNIIDIYDVGQDGDKYFFVMAYLPGASLKQLIVQKGRVAPVEALPILHQLSDALDYAHGKGLVHRDVKSANVLFDERRQAVLTDFGIVKAKQERQLTVVGTALGTPQYMAPEQAQGLEVDARTDEYALGIIAYEMLAGRVPFDGHSTTEILLKQIKDPLPPITGCCPDLTPAVEPVLQRAMTKPPAERYGSCGEFAAALEQALTQPVPTVEPRQPTPQPPSAGQVVPAEEAWGQLVIISGSHQGLVIPLQQNAFAIGRGGDNDLAIQDRTASRHHARIERQVGYAVITDQNSSNGTFVNGQRIQQIKLVGGETIKVGDTQMRLELI